MGTRGLGLSHSRAIVRHPEEQYRQVFWLISHWCCQGLYRVRVFKMSLAKFEGFGRFVQGILEVSFSGASGVRSLGVAQP